MDSGYQGHRSASTSRAACCLCRRTTGKPAAEGTYTANSRKIYTNGHALRIGGQVYDPQDGATYTVRGDLDHGVIHPLRRFVADRKGEAASK